MTTEMNCYIELRMIISRHQNHSQSKFYQNRRWWNEWNLV